eukprot:15462063-Alexandrium_andersonii.AAC.1
MSLPELNTSTTAHVLPVSSKTSFGLTGTYPKQSTIMDASLSAKSGGNGATQAKRLERLSNCPGASGAAM